MNRQGSSCNLRALRIGWLLLSGLHLTVSAAPERIDIQQHLEHTIRDMGGSNLRPEQARAANLVVQSALPGALLRKAPLTSVATSLLAGGELKRHGLKVAKEGELIKIVSSDAPVAPWMEVTPQRLAQTLSSAIQTRVILARAKNVVLKEFPTTLALQAFLKDELNVQSESRAQDVAQSFDPGLPTQWVELDEDITVLRLSGGTTQLRGSYHFCCMQRGALPGAADSPRASRFGGWADAGGLAPPPGNTLAVLAAVTLPRGTKMLVGGVADNFLNALGEPKPGGNAQVYVPDVVEFPQTLYDFSYDQSTPKDIVVLLEDGNRLWFTPRSRRQPS